MITLFNHDFNNYKATGIIKIARTLKNISPFEFHAEWKNITKETTDDTTAVIRSRSNKKIVNT